MNTHSATGLFLGVASFAFPIVSSDFYGLVSVLLTIGRVQSRTHSLHEMFHEFLYVGVVLGGSLEVLDLVLSSQRLPLLFGHLPFVFQVHFVPHQHFRDAWVCVLIDGLEPGLDVLEGSGVGDVVGYYDAVRLLVETERNRSESFLSSRIPYLDGDGVVGARLLEHLGDVVEANGGFVGGGELLLGVHLEHGGLAYGSVAQDDQLDFLLRHILIITITLSLTPHT